MDLDPAEEEELDSFSLLLPLPYRLGLLVVLGVWLWGLNVHGMALVKIVRPPLSNPSRIMRPC